MLATVSFTVCGQILMKKGVNQIGELSLKTVMVSPFIIIGGLCYISGFLVWLNVLRLLPLSIAYPASSIAYVLVIFAAAIFLGEAITMFKLLGIICICLGVLFIGRS